jgi:integrase
VWRWNQADAANGKVTEKCRVVAPLTLSRQEALIEVGKLNLNQPIEEGSKATFEELARYYFHHKTFKKASTRQLHQQIINRVCVPRWGKEIATEISSKEIKAWLRALEISDQTRSKYRTIMGAVYLFAQCDDVIPKGEKFRPTSYVKGFSPASEFESITFTPEETLAVLSHLKEPERTLLLLVAATGLRQSEVLALRWEDLNHGNNFIRVNKTYVHGKFQEGTKSKASRAKVPMQPLLGALLKDWQNTTLYNTPTDLIFASTKVRGKRPRVGSMIVADHIRPALIKAGVVTKRNGKLYSQDNEEITRVGFHTFRHSLGTFLSNQNQNLKLIQTVLRHSSEKQSLHYIHTRPDERLAAQGTILEKLLPESSLEVAVQ